MLISRNEQDGAHDLRSGDALSHSDQKPPTLASA